MDPIGEVPLKHVSKWASKNLNVQRVSKQLYQWYTVYDKVLFKVFRFCNNYTC